LLAGQRMYIHSLPSGKRLINTWFSFNKVIFSQIK
jgi:hypothetical protein